MIFNLLQVQPYTFLGIFLNLFPEMEANLSVLQKARLFPSFLYFSLQLQKAIRQLRRHFQLLNCVRHVQPTFCPLTQRENMEKNIKSVNINKMYFHVVFTSSVHEIIYSF